MSAQEPRYDSLAAALMAHDVAAAAIHVARGESAHQVYDLGLGQRSTMLEIIANQSMYPEVEFLLQNGAQPNFAGVAGKTAIYLPAMNGDERMVRLLLRYGADPNFREPDRGQTPLHVAAMEGRTEVVKTLIGFGADVNVMDRGGITPLMLAAHGGHYDTSELLSNGRLIESLRQQFDGAKRAQSFLEFLKQRSPNR